LSSLISTCAKRTPSTRSIRPTRMRPVISYGDINPKNQRLKNPMTQGLLKFHCPRTTTSPD
jgi:hypothetical protein